MTRLRERTLRAWAPSRTAVTLATLMTLLVPSICSGRQTPSAFVHGLGNDGTAWQSAADWMAQQLWITPIRPTLGWQNQFGTQATNLQSALSAYSDVVGTANSNGGVVVRQYVHQYGSNSKIHRVMAIGSPHYGAQLAASFADGVVADYAAYLFYSLTSPFEFYWLNDPENFDPDIVTLTAYDNFAFLLVPVIEYILYTQGWDPGAPVLSQMRPSSSFIASLNSSASLNIEAANAYARIGVGTSVDPYRAFLYSLSSDAGTWSLLRDVLYVFSVEMYNYYYFEQWDPYLAAGAWRWAAMADALYYNEADWSVLIGAFNNPYLMPSDAILPTATEAYPQATEQQYFTWPQYNIRHVGQKDTQVVRDYMESVFRTSFNVGDPPPPPPSLNVSITGPGTIKKEGGYSWTCSATGGGGSYSYQWERSNNGGSYYVVGSGSSYSTYVSYGTPSFSLRCNATSGAMTGSATRPVGVIILPPL